MENEELNILSLDIGTNSVHGVIAKYNNINSKIEVLSANTYVCDGIKDGAITAIQDAKYTIERFFINAEKDFFIKEFDYILCAVRGSLIEVFNSGVRYKISEDYEVEITNETVEDIRIRLEDSCKIEEKKEIVDVIPQQYIIDEDQKVVDPIGMSGKYLELTAIVVVGTKNNMNNIRKAANDPVLKYGYIALSDTLVSKEDKKNNCIFVDIGDMTTGVVVYRDGKIKCSFELNFGSYYVTRDIIKELKVNQKEASNIKETYGVVLGELIGESDNVEFEYTTYNGKKQMFTKRQLIDIIKPQIELQLGKLEEMLEEKNVIVDEYVGGFILTGAGALLKGMSEAFEKFFNTVAKVANFTDDDVVCSDKAVIDSQIYTTALAVIKNEAKDFVKSERKSKGLFSKLRDLFKEIS